MKIFTGKVVSKKMEKTATVAVERVFVHPVYKKRTKRIKKYQVHDELGVGIVGSLVKFTASRPYSKTKRWKIITAFKKTTGDKPVDELNADMSSSFRRTPRLKGGEDVIEAVGSAKDKGQSTKKKKEKVKS